jgi:Fe-S-cluster containining protein
MLPPGLQTLKFPAERRATCDRCPRVGSDGYRPDYRCCTYHPRVPNFLLGFALGERGGPERLQRAADAGFLMPEGFLPSAGQWADFLADVGEGRFGKSEAVLCPFLSGGLCGIYRYRNGVCSTFFCHFDQGSAGERFWESLQTLVVQVELALGQWALTEVGFDVPAYIARMNRMAPAVASTVAANRGWSVKARREAWGKDFGRELAIYAACAEKIRGQRESLWAIANRAPILEADAFEMACETLVGEKYRDQIEDDWSDGERETVPPKELWRTVRRRHLKLWNDRV